MCPMDSPAPLIPFVYTEGANIVTNLERLNWRGKINIVRDQKNDECGMWKRRISTFIILRLKELPYTLAGNFLLPVDMRINSHLCDERFLSGD